MLYNSFFNISLLPLYTPRLTDTKEKFWGGGWGGGFGVDEAFQIFHIFFTLKVEMPYRIFRCEIV
jgi:hypothetical protein